MEMVKMSEEETKPKTTPEPDIDELIDEELEEYSDEELDQLAKQLKEEEERRKRELEEFARRVSLAEILECVEKIKKFVEVYKESIRTIGLVEQTSGEKPVDPSQALLRQLFGGKLF